MIHMALLRSLKLSRDMITCCHASWVSRPGWFLPRTYPRINDFFSLKAINSATYNPHTYSKLSVHLAFYNPHSYQISSLHLAFYSKKTMSTLASLSSVEDVWLVDPETDTLLFPKAALAQFDRVLAYFPSSDDYPEPFVDDCQESILRYEVLIMERRELAEDAPELEAKERELIQAERRVRDLWEVVMQTYDYCEWTARSRCEAVC